jgi:transforming growth factor-beta-induced protein
MALDQDTLTQILLYHVVVGSNVQSSMLMDSMDVVTSGTFADPPFTISIGKDDEDNDLPPVIITPDSVQVNFVTTDIQGTNGVIHLVDKVILPQMD